MEDMSTMDSIIETCEKELEELKRYNEFIDKRDSYYYSNRMDAMRGLITPKYYLKDEIKVFEQYLELYKKCKDNNIDLTKKYPLTDNIYLSFWVRPNSICAHFYLDDDSWFYNNFMSSHSELNTWIHNLVIQTFDDMSATRGEDVNFGYDYVSDCIRGIDIKRDNNEPKIDVNRMYNYITSLLEFLNPDGAWKNLNRRVCSMIDFYIQNMKEACTDYPF